MVPSLLLSCASGHRRENGFPCLSAVPPPGVRVCAEEWPYPPAGGRTADAPPAGTLSRLARRRRAARRCLRSSDKPAFRSHWSRIAVRRTAADALSAGTLSRVARRRCAETQAHPSRFRSGRRCAVRWNLVADRPPQVRRPQNRRCADRRCLRSSDKPAFRTRWSRIAVRRTAGAPSADACGRAINRPFALTDYGLLTARCGENGPLF